MGRSSWNRILIAITAVAGALSAQTCQAGWQGGFGPAGLHGEVRALANFDDGTGMQVYAGGFFDAAGGAAASNFARWNGAGWEPLGPPGVALRVDALAVYDDGTGAALYAGGKFAFGGAIGALVRWSAAGWIAVSPPMLPGTFEEAASVLHVHDDGTGPALYVGAGMRLGGSTALGVVRWNGTTFTTVATYSQCAASSLATFDDGTGPALYAGHGGQSVRMWRNGAWTALPSMAPHHLQVIRALEVFDDGTGPALYAAGTANSQSPAVAATGLVRWNGSAWTGIGSMVPGTALRGLAAFDDGSGLALYGCGSAMFVGGVQTLSCVLRWNGAALTGVGQLPAPPFPSYVNTILATNAGGTPRLVAGRANANGVAQWDGANWSMLDQPIARGAGGAVEALCAFDAGIGSRLYAKSGSRVLRLDAGAWTDTQVPASIFDRLEVFDAGFGPRLWVPMTVPSNLPAVAAFDGAGWSSWWWSGVSGYPRALSAFDDGSGTSLFVGGRMVPFGFGWLLRWTGQQVVNVGTFQPGIGDSAATIAELRVWNDGSETKLYAAGHFAQVNGVGCNGIATWNGQAFQPLLGGVTRPYTNPIFGNIVDVAEIRALALFDDGGGEALYAAGTFNGASGLAVRSIAKWNGSAWFDVGGGVSTQPGSATEGSINDLVVYDDGTGPALYAIGTFGAAGGIAASNIARWNGANWSPLGGGLALLPDTGVGLPPSARALAVCDVGDGMALLAGGGIASAGGVPSEGIACWAPARPRLAVLQPAGPGTPVYVSNSGLGAGREYFNVFSGELCPNGPGTGPYLGLCASNPGTLVAQLLVPVNTYPLHFIAGAAAVAFGPYSLPSGLVVEGLCIELSGGGVSCYSAARRFTVP